MGATYYYQTGKMTRDFQFVEQGNACRLSSLPVRVGSEWCRKYCNHFEGTWVAFGVPASYVRCKHPDAKDSEGCGEAIRLFYEQLQLEAFCALEQ